MRELRKSNGLTQSDIASKLDVNFQVISQYERGQIMPTLYWIKKFCECINEDPSLFYLLVHSNKPVDLIREFVKSE